MEIPLKVFCAPARYTQGPHATEQLGAEIRNLGLEGPALIVAGAQRHSPAVRDLGKDLRRSRDEL